MLKKNIDKIVANDEVKEKFEPNWLGSFVVVATTRLGAPGYLSCMVKKNKKLLMPCT